VAERASLEDAFEKLRRAKHHFEVLRPQIEAFEQRDAHRISVSVNRDAGRYTFYAHDLEPVDPDWGLVIGDCIHNARTALDYLVVRLWAMVTGTDAADVEDVQFPIRYLHLPDPVVDNVDVQKAFAHARNSFKSDAAKFSKEPGFSGYLATIEQLQPFNHDNPSIWGLDDGAVRFAMLPNALERLARLDNLDKHRVPHATWTGVHLFAGPSIDHFAPEGFKSLGGGTGFALEHNAEVGNWSFATPLPGEWEPNEMQMKACFPVQVAFGKPGIFNGVLEVLQLCLWAVESVLIIFNPVFENGQPPLPVTAIAEPRA
jgi:hypothetical protein